MILKGFLAIKTFSGFDELERYLQTTEKYLQKAQGEFKTWVDKQVQSLSDEERDEFFDIYSEDHWDYAETFPNILRKSFLVSAYSFLEYKMIFICEWLKKEHQIPSNWDDSRGNTLDKFKRYFKHACLELTDNDWQEIKNYRKIRNCIVHNRGLVKGSRQEQELRAYITQKNIISKELIEEQIALTEQFCREAAKNIWVFLKKVLDAYELQKQKQKADS